MDPRTPSEIQATGTLPLGGKEAVPVPDQPAPSGRPEWVEDARANLGGPGRYLAYEDADRRVVVPVEREWTRIGRSLAADIRFDDATVSRRHALVVNQADGARVLDDRSLNGIRVNGRRVEIGALRDGDEITVGRHALFFLDTTVAGATTTPPAAVAE